MELKHKIKECIKAWTKGYIIVFLIIEGLIGFFTFIGFLGSFEEADYKSSIDAMIKGPLFFLICMGFSMLCHILIIVYKSTTTNVSRGINYFKSGNNENIYLREAPNDWSPAIVSLLLDKNIEKSRDYTATILNLSLKEYIKIEKINDKVFFKKLREPIGLNNHEKYIYETVFNNIKINEETFKSLVIQDVVDMGLINVNFETNSDYSAILQSTNNSENKLTWRSSLLVSVFFIFIFISGLNSSKLISDIIKYISYLMILITTFIVWNAINAKCNIKFNLTKEALKSVRKWKNFSKFIKDFTMIKEHIRCYIV